MSVTLITGTGLATARHFARQGHGVWAGVRNPASAADLRAAIEYLDEMRERYGFAW
jgi:NAD(P)-dependent dehydrogenase (short-subunit alcohol dehydrogenase family)